LSEGAFTIYKHLMHVDVWDSYYLGCVCHANKAKPVHWASKNEMQNCLKSDIKSCTRMLDAVLLGPSKTEKLYIDDVIELRYL
jgi:hypothetical protein